MLYFLVVEKVFNYSILVLIRSFRFIFILLSSLRERFLLRSIRNRIVGVFGGVLWFIGFCFGFCFVESFRYMEMKILDVRLSEYIEVELK